MKIASSFAVATLLTLTVDTNAQLSVSSLDTATTITFDETLTGVSNGQFTGSGFQSTPTTGQLDSDAWAATGWSNGSLSFGGTQITANTDYTRGAVTSAQTAGGFYAYGTADRQLMIQPGGSDWAPGTLTLRVQNNTGSTVTSWSLAYELYLRNDQGRGNSFNFSYSTDGTTFSSAGLNSALFTYTSPSTADAPSAWTLLGTPSNTVSATVAASGYLYLRWSGADFDGSGSRDEFGLDDISVTALTPVPEPSSLLLLPAAVLGLCLRRRS